MASINPNVQDNDKKFHELYWSEVGADSKSSQLRPIIEDLTSAMNTSDYDRVQHMTFLASQQLDNFLLQLQELPVSSEMEPIKQDYISSLRSEKRAILAIGAVAKYRSDGNEALEKSSYDEAQAQFATASSLEDRAEQGYYKLYSTTSTTVSTPTTSAKVSTFATPTMANMPTQTIGYQVRIESSGHWEGSYGDVTGHSSIEGYGSKTYDLFSPNAIIAAVIQKSDSGSGTLTVQILKDGKILKQGSTTASYGIVSVGAYVT